MIKTRFIQLIFYFLSKFIVYCHNLANAQNSSLIIKKNFNLHLIVKISLFALKLFHNATRLSDELMINFNLQLKRPIIDSQFSDIITKRGSLRAQMKIDI